MLLLAIVTCLSFAFSVSCHSTITPIFYDVFGLVSFNGSDLTNTSEGCSLFGISLACLNSSNAKLTDGSIGPVTSISGSLGQFFAFGRQSSNSLGRVTFTLPGSVSTVILYFFNSPNTSIGLPMISVFTMGSPVGYFFANNDDLSQTDSRLKNVTLHLQQLNSAVQLDFTFTNQSAIDWLLLSEVILYNDTVVSPSMDNIIFDQGNTSTIQIRPANLQSSITLTCSVINSGSFVWQWMYNGDMLYTGDQFQILIKDATRTSTLTINSLSISDVGNYTCTANFSGKTMSKQHILNFIPSMISSISPSSTVQVATPSPSLSSILQSLNVTPSPPIPPSNNFVIGIVVAIILVIAALLVLLVVLLIVVFICKRKQKPISDLHYRTSIKYNITPKATNPTNDIDSSVVVAAEAENASPEAFPQITDNESIAKMNLEREKSAQPQLIKLTSLNGYQLKDNPLYDKNIVPENLYNDILDHPDSHIYEQANDAVIYAVPQAKESLSFEYQNPIYDTADGLPFVFVESPEYSDGAIYAIPNKKVDNSPIKIMEENLVEISELGMGQFGAVVLAETIGLSLKDLRLSLDDNDKSVSIKVAVKKVRDKENLQTLTAFEKETSFMSHLNHKNVIKLLAVSHHDSTERFIVMEYMENGDLNEYLVSHNFTTKHPPPLDHQISPQILLSMCIQVANGMAYLASCNYIHRDLAARNCLVGEDNTIKIADFGLSRNLYDNAYYRVRGKAKMPVRWMSYECFYGKFSEKSDVWAYGVTAWEIYTMGREPPYSTFSDRDIIEDALKNEYRTLLPKPTSCPSQVYNVIETCCFEGNPDERAHFNDIYSELIKVQAQLYV